jgi:ketosteroid isomerase-like protein
VGQFDVAALSERRNSLRIQDRRSEAAATKIKLTHYREKNEIGNWKIETGNSKIVTGKCGLGGGN